MPAFSLPDLGALAQAIAASDTVHPPLPNRLISIWEITQWILPMAPEHLRRVLAAEPGLPQGSAATEGGTRWFSPAEVAALRGHFARRSRQSRYQPARPVSARAPLIALTAPQGRAGRTLAAAHLATAAALSGYKVLLIDADPAGSLAQVMQIAASPESGTPESSVAELGTLGLIARSAARHLRQSNETRLDRGDAPLAMDAVLSAALGLHAADLIRPTIWPGLDLLPASPALMQADLQIGRWRMAQARWHPWRAVAEALDSDGLRERYDLILCDTGRGLGPLALSVLASADVLLAVLPLAPGALQALSTGLEALARALGAVQTEAQITAQALGHSAQPLQWRKLAVLPTRGGDTAAGLLAGYAAKLGPALLPAALPDIPAIASGQAAQFYDLDYRDVGRLIYAPQREATEAAWRGVADLLASLWAEDNTTARTDESSGQGRLPLG
ncbi:ParA family protein [Cypionkella sinensis]|uniref:ParA family protein n=1 Tax=Cypionkella sinensis TaxID=1756043 RepID=UPI00362F31A2